MDSEKLVVEADEMESSQQLDQRRKQTVRHPADTEQQHDQCRSTQRLAIT